MSLCITISGPNYDDAATEVWRRLQIFRIQDLFNDIRLLQIEIDPAEDMYITHAPDSQDFAMPALGMKSGPNLQFFRSMNQLTDYDYVLLNETDAFPQSQEWGKELIKACNRSRDKVIAGSRYHGHVNLSPDIRDHLNGNAIYNLSHSLFRSGLLEQWEKALIDACLVDPDTAYDILFARLRNDSRFHSILDNYPLVASAIYQTSETSLIYNASLPPDSHPSNIQKCLRLGASILHGKHFMQSSVGSCLSSSCFLRAEDALWRSQLFQDLNPTDRAWMIKKKASSLYQASTSISKDQAIPLDPPNPKEEDINSISFFVKTFSSELEVAAYAIASISMFCLERHEIVVLTDNNNEKSMLARAVSDICSSLHSSLPSITFLCLEEVDVKARDGYIDQQVLKMTANLYCRHSLILHVDSDSVFWREFNADDFLLEGKIILPYSDWGRDEFLSNDILRKLQILSGVQTHNVDHINCAISSLNPKQQEELGISSFSAANGCSSATLLSGEQIRWTSSYPDIAWKCSSRIWGTFPYDTMRSHYMIRASSLEKCVTELERRFDCSIWDLAYNRDTIPVLSEFQIIGNWILGCASSEEAGKYIPTHWHQLFSRHSSKIPMIKYNLKSHPLDEYRRILNGEFSSVIAKAEVLQLLRSPGWC